MPVACPVLTEAAPGDPDALLASSRSLERYDWMVVASARAVRAVAAARDTHWPSALRTAAVGVATAQALTDAGAVVTPVVAPEGGADPLWDILSGAAAWPGTRVLVPTTPGGRTVLAERLRAAGATVDEVEAYRMVPRALAEIAREWRAAAPDGAVIASPRVAHTLVAALGAGRLSSLHAVVAIGASTAAALAALGVTCVVAEATTFTSAAAALAAQRDARRPA